jgi:hypothetical protein
MKTLSQMPESAIWRVTAGADTESAVDDSAPLGRRRDATPAPGLGFEPGHPLLIAFGPHCCAEVRCVGCCLVLSEVPPYKECELVAR